MTSLTILSISCKSPSVKVIRSNNVFDAFVFFRGIICSCGRRHLSWVNVIYGSVPRCYVSVSGLGEGDLCPSCSSSLVFCCSSNFTVSRATWTLVIASSFLRFSASYTIRSFVSSFLHCTTDFSVSTTKPAGACHSDGQDSRTANITSSVTIYGKSCHVFVGSFCTLMKTWWKSAFNFPKLCKLLYTVGAGSPKGIFGA